jgi:hypothetical protein
MNRPSNAGSSVHGVSDDLSADMQRKAEAIVAAAAANREELDFSLESLVTLDAMLDRLFGRRWSIGRSGRLDTKQFTPMIEPIGAYVGETLRRNVGGEWGFHDEHGPGLELPSGMWTFPLAKADKRFHNGHEDSLALYGGVMASMGAAGEPPPAGSDEPHEGGDEPPP